MAEESTGRTVGRPRKLDAERMVPVSTNLPPSVFDALCKIAVRRDVPLAVIVRERVCGTVTVSGAPVSQP
jgi:hypothetical protein